MRRNTLLACTTACLLALLTVNGSAQLTLSPPIVNPENGHTYMLLNGANWTTSEAEAVQLGGHLATIRNQAEQDWVFNTFGSYGGTQRLLWIGLNDVQTVFQFTWTSGEPLTYTHWDAGEPNNAGGIEFYVAMYYPNYHAPGTWNDWSNRTTDPIGIPFAGVVEIAPEPGASAFLVCLSGTGAGWLLRRRKQVASQKGRSR